MFSTRKNSSDYGTFTSNGFVANGNRDNRNIHPTSGCGGVLFILLAGASVVSFLAYFAF